MLSSFKCDLGCDSDRDRDHDRDRDLVFDCDRDRANDRNCDLYRDRDRDLDFIVFHALLNSMYDVVTDVMTIHLIITTNDIRDFPSYFMLLKQIFRYCGRGRGHAFTARISGLIGCRAHDTVTGAFVLSIQAASPVHKAL
jgi:hypothetical protein